MIHKYLSDLVRRFNSDEEGVSAVEFALLVPVMVLIYMATIEVSFLMIVDRKVTSTASSLGDLVARGTTIEVDEMNGIFEASEAIFKPYDGATARMRVTSVIDDGGTTKVAWSRAKNMAPKAPGSAITVPPGLISTDGSVIFAEVEYSYNSTLGFFLQGSQEMSDEFWLRPRRVAKVDAK